MTLSHCPASIALLTVSFRDRILEFLKEHTVDLHALIPMVSSLMEERISVAKMFIGAGDHGRGWYSTHRRGSDLRGRGSFHHLVIIELLLKVFAVGEEVEELESGLLRLQDDSLRLFVKKLLEEVVLAGTTTFDLDEVGRREDRSKKSQD